MKGDNPFSGKRIWIVTQHHKEKAIAPVLNRMLGADCQALDGINTDLFGTFTGEIPRTGTAVDALRLKCRAGLQLTGRKEPVLASEGSFGPHPSLPFVPFNEEWLMLMAPDTLQEWLVCYRTTHTNFAGTRVVSWPELKDFALQAGFPHHALILRAPEPAAFIKGLRSWALLKYHFNKLRALHPAVGAETDMRAMFNPTRLEAIHRAARKLALLLLRRCPACQAYGFAETDIVPGLPCNWCGAPTRLAKARVLCCAACGYAEERPIMHGAHRADAAYCDYCNP
ncbi:MAG: hypothetical protein KatS3mg032_2402 [Cyclobacteriaceae bacterium]|nr:MAG: hypothetical protein KatS3mg032_2402 [Cyclobacteriaceae bacterium]